MTVAVAHPHGRKLISSILFLATLVFLTTPQADAQVREWTILVFLNGDNNLEPAAIDDVNEMEAAAANGDANVVVQIDRCPGYDRTNGDWKGTRRYLISPDSDTRLIHSTLIQDLGEVDMGNPSSLVDFAVWGINNYPADKYFLVCWNHGDGWTKDATDAPPFKGFSDDDTNNSRIGVANGELAGALAQIKNALGRKIDLIGFDACLMGMIEVGYEAKDYVEAMVSSEEVEGFDGWDYTAFLNRLSNRPSMGTFELGDAVAQTFVQSGDATQSVVDLTRFDGLAADLDAFAAELISAQNAGYGDAISGAVSRAQNFYDFSSRDLYDFAGEIKSSSVPASLKTQAQAVMDAVDLAVYINYRKTYGYNGAHGIAIYIPSYGYDNAYNGLDLSADTRWDDFARTQNGGGGQCGIAGTSQSRPHWNLCLYVIAFGALFFLGTTRRKD